MKHLMLWLEAPLQCWGADSKFDRRDSLEFPTKSGVFGILLAADGASGPQQELLRVLSESPMFVSAFKQTRTSEPALADFHMIGNGYLGKGKWAELHIPRTVSGTKAVGGGAKLTYRYYLQDKAFGVVLSLPDDLAERFRDALAHPKFDLFLGRKCCVPTDFIGQGVFDSLEDAKEAIRTRADQKHLIHEFDVSDTSFDNPEKIRLCDVPVQFGTHKIYRDRAVVKVCDAGAQVDADETPENAPEDAGTPPENTGTSLAEPTQVPPEDRSDESEEHDLFTWKGKSK